MTVIQLGEPILGTRLVKRYQAGHEISPIYQPREDEVDVLNNACQEAESAGYTVVTVGQSTYVQIGEKWYVWSIPQEKGK